jgi:hypothetical protein
VLEFINYKVFYMNHMNVACIYIYLVDFKRIYENSVFFFLDLNFRISILSNLKEINIGIIRKSPTNQVF